MQDRARRRGRAGRCRSASSSPRSCRRCGRSGWATRRVQLLRAGRPVSRRAADGRRAATCVSRSPPAGVRSRAVALRRRGQPAMRSATAATARHDLTARLEINEWQGAVEPGSWSRSLHAVPEPDRDGAGGCSDVHVPRSRRSAGGTRVRGARRAARAPGVTPRGDSARTVLDRRGEGVLGMLAELMTTGEPLLVVCADVSRRRALFARDLAPERFARSALTSVSARCARDEVAEPVGVGAALCLAEHGALEHEPRPSVVACALRSIQARVRPRPSAASACRAAALGGHARRRRRELPAPGLGPGRARVLPPGARARVLAARLALPRSTGRWRLPAERSRAPRWRRCSRATGAIREAPLMAGRCLRVLTELGLVADASAQALPLGARSPVKSGSSWSARERFGPTPRICEEGPQISERADTTDGRSGRRRRRRAATATPTVRQAA